MFSFSCGSAAQAEVLTPRDRTPFIDVTLAFLEHCEWRHVVIAPKYGKSNSLKCQPDKTHHTRHALIVTLYAQ